MQEENKTPEKEKIQSVECVLFKKFKELQERVSLREIETQRELKEMEQLFIDNYWENIANIK